MDQFFGSRSGPLRTTQIPDRCSIWSISLIYTDQINLTVEFDFERPDIFKSSIIYSSSSLMENFCKMQIQNWTEIEHRSLSMDMIDAYFNACNIFYLSNQYLISNNSFWTWKLFVEAGRADNQKIICCYFWKAQHFFAQVSFLSKIGDDSSVKSNTRLLPK